MKKEINVREGKKVNIAHIKNHIKSLSNRVFIAFVGGGLRRSDSFFMVF